MKTAPPSPPPAAVVSSVEKESSNNKSENIVIKSAGDAHKQQLNSCLFALTRDTTKRLVFTSSELDKYIIASGVLTIKDMCQEKSVVMCSVKSVCLIENGKLREFLKGRTFINMGYDFDQVKQLDPHIFSQLQQGKKIN